MKTGINKIITAAAIVVLSFCLVSCGNGTLSGKAEEFSNKDKSFSVELPSKNEKSWVINDDSPSSMLDMTDKNDTVNIQIQCLSKMQAQNVATDLEAYRDYAMVNVLSDFLADASMKDADFKTPDFIKNSTASDFSISDSIRGSIVFMESESCYYTYMVMAVDKAYSANKNIIEKSILSLKELK